MEAGDEGGAGADAAARAQRLQGPGVSWSEGLGPPPSGALVAQLGYGEVSGPFLGFYLLNSRPELASQCCCL